MARSANKTGRNRAANLGKHAEAGGPGRPKGCKNLTSRQAQQEILDTLDKLNKAKVKDLGTGKLKLKYPKGYLYFLAENEPKTFSGLFGRCLPRDMTLDANVSMDWQGLVAAWSKGPGKPK